MSQNILIVSNDIKSFLDFASNDNIIAQILLVGGNYITNEFNFIKHEESEEGDIISFLPKSKYEKVKNEWEDQRVKIKIGRFVKKTLSEFAIKNFGITDTLVEKFVNSYKFYFKSDPSKLAVVSGKDIRKFYLEENYHQNYRGPIWNSCMRQKERNKYLKLYQDNDQIKMLVLFDDDNKVRARALLWNDVKSYNDESIYKIMDRIYYIYDHDVILFKKWAEENGYIYKWEQNAKTENFFEINSVKVKLDLYIDLEKYDLLYYPYLDTFKYFTPNKKRFSNSQDYPYIYILTQTNGSVERERS